MQSSANVRFKGSVILPVGADWESRTERRNHETLAWKFCRPPAEAAFLYFFCILEISRVVLRFAGPRGECQNLQLMAICLSREVS